VLLGGLESGFGRPISTLSCLGDRPTQVVNGAAVTVAAMVWFELTIVAPEHVYGSTRMLSSSLSQWTWEPLEPFFVYLQDGQVVVGIPGCT